VCGARAAPRETAASPMSTPPTAAAPGAPGALWRWIDRNFLELGREMRLSYLPPLMVYIAAGISGLTGIVGTFFVKEYLGLSAEFLAALGFWAGIPWALKMPLGHLVDLIWKHKAGLVYLGATLICASLLIMIGLLADRAAMERIMDADAWFVLTALLAPVGYVLQDVVADAMTVEAVPRFDEEGRPTPEDARKLMHTTMQTLGRVAIIGGTVLVAGANVWLFRGAEQMPEAAKAATYLLVYQLALIIPVVSVLGVLLAGFIRRRDARRLSARGFDAARIEAMLDSHPGRPPVNWWILGGGLAFAVVSLSVGLGKVPAGQEIIFGASMTIIVFLMWRLVRELEPDARATLVGTALVVFVFRALPGPGAGSTWWMIDVLKFDQQFLATLSLITSFFTLLGLFLFRRFMAERSIAYIVGFLTVVGTVLALPIVGMYFGLHEWTARHTGGVVDARFIALFDTALESPLGQVAMVPMLAWIARSAPDKLKATYFAVMASFTNLALSAAQLGTKYLNQIYAVTREVKDAATGAIKVPADYSQLGDLLILSTALGFALPLLAILFVKSTRFRSA
jgi:hypothetical protein